MKKGAQKQQPGMGKRKKIVVRTAKPLRVARPMSVTPAANRAKAWLNLLQDPCTQPLAPPCYTGADGGYLVRTTDIATVSIKYAGTANPSWKGDFAIDVCPSNFSTTSGLTFTLQPTGTSSQVSITTGVSNFITNNISTVKEYRPVACCVKFIPTGNYNTRSGVVGRSYNAGRTLLPGAAYAVGPLLTGMQRVDPCGSVPHEVKWLPTNLDQNYTTVGVTDEPGVGCCRLVGVNIDGFQTAADLNVSGYFEITVAWEWLPAQSSGVTSVTTAPNPHTMQQVLGSIGNVGAFLYETAHTAARTIRGITPFVRTGATLLSAGVATSTMRAPQLLMA